MEYEEAELILRPMKIKSSSSSLDSKVKDVETKKVPEEIIKEKSEITYRPITKLGNGRLAAYDKKIGGVIIFDSANYKLNLRAVEYSSKHKEDFETWFPSAAKTAPEKENLRASLLGKLISIPIELGLSMWNKGLNYPASVKKRANAK